MSVWIVWDTKYRHVIAVYLDQAPALAYALGHADWEVFPQIVTGA